MEISCALPPGPNVVEHTRVAEQLGYARAWIYDSPALYPDVWVTVLRIFERTSRIAVGPGVLVPSLRHVVAQASAIATLEQLAPGRLVVAIGTGFTGRMTMGQPALRWSFVEAYIRQLRALLRGEAVEVDGAFARLLHPPGFAPPFPIRTPILVAANGPKGLAVARELGDGVVCVNQPQAGFSWCALLTLGTVLDEGEDASSERALAAAGPGLTVAYHGTYEIGGAAAVDGLLGGAEWRARIEAVPANERHLALHELHLVGVTERDRPLLNGEMLKTFTWTGSASEIRDRLAQAEAHGATEIMYAPMGPNVARELEAFKRAAS
ncbi:MAG: LLM class flavin-dependent oxidoreductase [Deltaproteobacteria bacterium]|nr:LLM class flavin-dependent oxidoreductase [Deltaproteobacteria bacterium]